MVREEHKEEEMTTTKHVIEIPSPDKLSAKYWEQFLQEGTPPEKVEVL